MCVRGLKLLCVGCKPVIKTVARRVRAWIETKSREASVKIEESRTPCACVD